MKLIYKTSSFKRDSKLVVKRGYDIFKLDEVLLKLHFEEPLPTQCRAHLLHGDWKGYWECHIGPDWLLVYRDFDDHIELARTGTHGDIFG
jgi:mRNA interferase YafQ